MKKFTLSVLFLFAALNLSAEIDHPLTERKISFESGYFTTLNTNRAIGNFGIESFQALNAPFEFLVINSTDTGGLANFYLKYIIFLGGEFAILYNPFTLAYHEYGHFSRSKAYGGNPAMYYNADDVYWDQGRKPYGDFWSYYKRGYTVTYKSITDRNNNAGGYVKTNSFSGVVYENEHRNPFNRSIYISGGGLNNQMYLTELMEDDIYLRGGSIAYTWTYIYQKLSTFLYSKYGESTLPDSKGDPSAIISAYKSKGYNISRSDLEVYSIASLFLSSTTYMLVGHWFIYVTDLMNAKENTQNITPLEYNGVRIPDVSFYITDRGLTYKVKSGYRVESGDYIIPFAVEFVVKGSQAVEPSIGLIRVFDDFNLGGNLIFNTDIGDAVPVGFDLSGEYLFAGEQASVSAGWVHYSGSTYYGKRNLPDYSGGINYNELWLRASAYY